MAERRWLPKKGQVFKDRDELQDRLLSSGWEFEGRGAGLEDGEVTSYDVGVRDEKQKVWIIVNMEPVVRVTKIKRIKL